MFFTPRWKKNAKALVKGAKKFIDYKKDLLTDDRISEIRARTDDLKLAIKEKDKGKADEASKYLRMTCENALPYQKSQSGWEENIEVIFVAVVIALGLRAYYLQPFRIPTGSMQPTLNGIVGTPQKKEDWPAFHQRVTEYVLKGRKYVRVVNSEDRTVKYEAVVRDGKIQMAPAVKDFQWFHFFTRSALLSTDAKPLRLPAPASQTYALGLGNALREAGMRNNLLKEGQVLMEGFVDTGDLVLVNKFAYHFRKPERGEVFVFDTMGIRGIREHGGAQSGGTHYIKRLVGVPGDELQIRKPDLIVNGKVAAEEQIRKVAEGAPPFPAAHPGYHLAEPHKEIRRYLTDESDVLSLRKERARPSMREYAAMGDNTANSLDSRYWGTVKEFNVVGPALFSLWPITSGHWGFIR